jgi:class 3 adenylate cyclase
VNWYRRNQFIANVVFGFAMSTVGVLAMNAGGIRPGDPNVEPNAWFFVLMLVSISEFLLFIFQGYISKAAWRAALGAVCVAIGATLARLIPIAGIRMSDFTSPIGEVLSVVLNVGISSAAYLGAVVQARAEKETNLMRNDQAALLAEMVRLQWKLSNEAAAVCVMVIDAAKSSEMKAAANPLAVEYSFRQYQEWIEHISAERGGKVHSTAGDGAVVAFTTCGLALSAARQIQTDVFRFNKDLNRLQHPFKRRIGLHTGEIIGDIDEVQFTEVIDIAAHIESTCPIGGIAVTDDVVQKLPDEQFIDLSVVVDGHQVYMISNATEYH